MTEEQKNVHALLDLNIDENDLAGEWQGQAAMMLEYGILSADAMQEEDEAKARLTVVTAEVGQDIRASPADYGLAKVSEAAITATMPTQPRYLTALKELDDARHRGRVLRAAVDAIGHRKSALQGMTELYLRQWFADPKSRDQPQALQDAASNTTKKTTRRRIRKRKET